MIIEMPSTRPYAGKGNMKRLPGAVFYAKAGLGGLWVLPMVAVLFAVFPVRGDDRTRSIINCDIQNGACIQMVGGRKVTLEILPRPVKAMRELTFTVTVDGPADDFKRSYIDLNMPAMDMGKNRVPLEYRGEGVFEGRGVIVRCISNLKTWQAKITFPDKGRAYFIFDVVY